MLIFIMKAKDIRELFSIGDLRLFPEACMAILMGDKGNRDLFFRQLLEINGYDVSYDWFASAYEEELSERGQKKQDFTPHSVGVITSAICGQLDGSTYEPTAGNGSMLIADWWRKAQAHLPFDFYPSKNPVECWELSDRALPILLLNLSIRGIVGVVHHGDVLEKTEKGRYLLLNPSDDALGFSIIRKVL